MLTRILVISRTSEILQRQHMTWVRHQLVFHLPGINVLPEAETECHAQADDVWMTVTDRMCCSAPPSVETHHMAAIWQAACRADLPASGSRTTVHRHDAAGQSASFLSCWWLLTQPTGVLACNYNQLYAYFDPSDSQTPCVALYTFKHVSLLLLPLLLPGMLMMLDVVANHMGPVADVSTVYPFNKTEHYHACSSKYVEQPQWISGCCD